MRELGGKEMARQAWNLEQRGESEVVAVTAGPWAGTALLVRQLGTQAGPRGSVIPFLSSRIHLLHLNEGEFLQT